MSRRRADSGAEAPRSSGSGILEQLRGHADLGVSVATPFVAAPDAAEPLRLAATRAYHEVSKQSERGGTVHGRVVAGLRPHRHHIAAGEALFSIGCRRWPSPPQSALEACIDAPTEDNARNRLDTPGCVLVQPVYSLRSQTATSVLAE